jgi:hypothetical protein
MAANWTRSGVSTARSTDPGATRSVNSDSRSQLPPGHPEIGESQGGAPQPGASQPALPEGHPDVGSAGAPAGPTELPSLDPLPASSKENRVENARKNIQVLRGIPADRLEPIMFAFRASLGVDCTHCHIKDQWEKDDKPAKQIARRMIKMTRDANSQLGLSGRVTCFTCHRGQLRPVQ